MPVKGIIPMRFSTYNIMTKRLNSGGHVILNGMRGTLDLIDEEAYKLILSQSEEEELSQEVLEQMGEFRSYLLERGYLTELGKTEELAKAEEFALELIKEREKKAVWKVVLIPNLGCNYRCTYCFERGTGYPDTVMTKKQVDAIFEIIKDKIDAGSSICLYGGEPLTKENRELVEYIIQKGTSIGKTITAKTNGHDLDHYMDLISSGKISGLQITLDGPKEIHDRRRISLDGESSYDKVLSNIRSILCSTDAQITLRINVDKRNAPSIPELMDDLDRAGILGRPGLIISAIPVFGEGGLTVKHNELRELELSVEAKYPQYREMFTGRALSVNKDILPALYFGHPVTRRVTNCDAFGEKKMFSPDGRIYSCHICLWRPDQVIGTFDESGRISWNQEVLNRWKRTTLGYNKECLKCKYAFTCGGGCHRPMLPGETSASFFNCDYYYNMFEDYLVRVTDEYLAAGNE